MTTPTDGGRSYCAITAHRTLLDPCDALVRDRLRVTTPSRTIVDLAAIEPAEVAAEVAALLGLP